MIYANSLKEAETNEIDLSTHKSDHIKALLSYLYTDTYFFNNDEKKDAAIEALTDVRDSVEEDDGTSGDASGDGSHTASQRRLTMAGL